MEWDDEPTVDDKRISNIGLAELHFTHQRYQHVRKIRYIAN